MPEAPFDADHLHPDDAERAHRGRWDDQLSQIPGTSTEKRRHHFVPQMWLRRWEDTSGRVSVVDAEHLRSFDTSTRKVMVVSDLYKAGVELDAGVDFGPEEALSVVEGAAAAALKVVFDGSALTEDQRYDLAFLIALQQARRPAVIDRLVPPDAGGLRAHLEEVAARMAALPDDAAAVLAGKSNQQAAEELLAGLDDFIGLERGFGYWNVFHHAHNLAALIYRREWTMLETNGALLLSDNPVPLPLSGGLRFRFNDETVTIDTPVPLGPHKLLAVGNRSRGDGELDRATGDLYGAMSNEIQMAKSTRFIIGPPIEQGAW